MSDIAPISIKLKRKYTHCPPRALKNMKSPGGNSGKNKHKKNAKNKYVPRNMVMYVNAQTGHKRMYDRSGLPAQNKG